MKQLFELWLAERNLLAQRLMVFLIFNSILFLGFIQLLEQYTLACGIASVGLLISILALWYFWHPSKRLGKLEKKIRSGSSELLGLSEEEFDSLKLGGVRGHQLVTIGIPSFFILIWLIGLFLAL